MLTIVEALAKGKCTKQHHKAWWSRQQSWKQKKRTVRKLGWSSVLQTAVRTAAFSLETCYSSSGLASVCSRKNPKLLPSVIETGYLWSSSHHPVLVPGGTPCSQPEQHLGFLQRTMKIMSRTLQSPAITSKKPSKKLNSPVQSQTPLLVFNQGLTKKGIQEVILHVVLKRLKLMKKTWSSFTVGVSSRQVPTFNNCI